MIGEFEGELIAGMEQVLRDKGMEGDNVKVVKISFSFDNNDILKLLE